MAIEHVNIADGQRHEPKGISTALDNTTYHANGAGSGEWRKMKSEDLEGLTGDGGQADRVFVSDGVGGFKLHHHAAYGSMTITNNSVAIPLTAVADTTFNTPAQFTLLTGVGAPWVSENLKGITFTTDRLTVPVTGIYEIILWMGIKSYPGSTAKICIRYRLNGGGYSARKPTVKSGGVGAEDQLNGFGLISLNAGDFLQLYVASDTTGNLTIGDCNSTLRLVEQTA